MKVFNFLKRCVLFYTLIGIVFFVCTKFRLNQIFHLEYREWIYWLCIPIFILGIVIGMIQLFWKIKIKWLKILLTCTFIFLLGVITPFTLFFTVFTFTPEHKVEKEGETYIAYVYSFLSTRVEYYKYAGVLLRGYELEFSEQYDGAIDPFEETKSETSQEKENLNENKLNQEANNPKDKQYEIWFQEKVGLKVLAVDYAMGKEAIQIVKTVDGGKNWKQMIENESQALWVHYYTQFVFLNEQIGFFLDPGRSGVSENQISLQITRNGGKSFEEVPIQELQENSVWMDELPTMESGKIRIKMYRIHDDEKEYIEYVSEDQGISWKKQ